MAEYKNVEEELDAMIHGTYEAPEEDETNNEDTDHAEEPDDVTDTNEQPAEDADDTDESDDDDGEENALEDDDSSEEPDEEDDTEDDEVADELDGDEPDDTDSEDDEDSDDTEDTSDDEDTTDTEDDADEADPEKTEDVDYKTQYEELVASSKQAREFFEKVSGVDIKANGKMTKSFTDPDKILQSQSMMYNYSDKMAGFKKYRPYMGPLKDRGMLEDSSKFDLAMSLIDGDKDALKKHIQDLGIDPIELDMDEINYTAESKTSSRELLEIEDALDVASNYGVKDRVFDTVMKEWDDGSYGEFTKNPAIQHDLAQQMSNGVYDTVMDRVRQTAVLDSRFAGMRALDQYNMAAAQINGEATTAREAEARTKEVADEAARVEAQAQADATKAEKATKAAEAKAYKAKVAKKNKAADDARKKAANASKNKPKSTRNKRKAEDPMDYDGKGLAKYLDDMIMGTTR